MNAEQAIKRSISHGEIVHLAHSEEAILALTAECDDNVDGNDEREFWGTTESGHEWRVHVALGAKVDGDDGMVRFSVRNPADENERREWQCMATSAVEAAHQYLAAFWSAEQREDGSWFSPTYEGDIDGDDLEIKIVE